MVKNERRIQLQTEFRYKKENKRKAFGKEKCK